MESNRALEQILTDASIQRLAQQFVSTTLNSQAVQETAGAINELLLCRLL
jgi:hypothetical protein